MSQRSIITSVILLISAFSAFAQQLPLDRLKREKPDIEQIRREIVDRSSPYYYPRLMAEFERNDTTMKLDKYRRLYLGYMFQEDYNPYRSNPFSKIVMENYNRNNLTRQECDSVIKYAKIALADNPFDLNQMSALISALRLSGQRNLASIWQYKLNYILLAIASTGTGLDEENAWYVIEPQHEYALLNIMGYTITNHLFYEPYYEYLTVVHPDGQSSGGFYFNIENILREYYRKYPNDGADETPDGGD